MANINGDVQRRVTLTSNIETIVCFESYGRNLSLQCTGGEVVFKLNGAIANIDDTTANTLQDGGVFECVESAQIDSLHLLSTVAAEVQWDLY